MKKQPGSKSDEPKQHDLSDFVQSASEDIAAEYRRIQKRATEDPGTAGDQGEENWVQLLRNWLPPTYQIVTKGRILGENGQTSPQVDVLVLHPYYPHGLLNKKLYLAGGVIGAFECKTTLRKQHIFEAVENGALIRRLLPSRLGSPYKELVSPICYGLLAHSHSWRRNPGAIIMQHLLEADARYVEHPRETLDFICVADLALWEVMKMPAIYDTNIDVSQHGVTTTGYVLDSTEIPAVGVLITHLLRRLAWEDASLKRLAEYFRKVQLQWGIKGIGRARPWDETVYSKETLQGLKSGNFSFDPFWSEWAQVFF